MKYPKPPIREALFDIRFDLTKPYALEDFAPYKEYLKDEFPVNTVLNTFQATFKADAMQSPEIVNIPNPGYAFRKKDGTKVIQITSTGFTLNIVNSYNEWDEHFGQFFSSLEVFSSMYPIKNINRIATRYINRILLPYEQVDFDDYINYMPRIPSVLLPAFNLFYLTMSIPSKAPNRNVIINSTYEPPHEGTVPFILDIDAFQTAPLENDLGKIKGLFSELRELKNSVFEDYITPKTRELFL